MKTNYRLALPVAAALLRSVSAADDVQVWRWLHAHADAANTEFVTAKDLCSILSKHTVMRDCPLETLRLLVDALLAAALPRGTRIAHDRKGNPDRSFSLKLEDSDQQAQLWGLLRLGYWVKVQARTPAGRLIGEPFWTRLLEWEHITKPEGPLGLLTTAVRTMDVARMEAIWRLPLNYQLQAWAFAVDTDRHRLDELQRPLAELLE